MIGQPPSFYDPTNAIVPEGPDYQQWIMENYGSGSSQFSYAQQQGPMSGNVPFPPQSQLHHVSVPQNPTHNEYHFVQAAQGPSYDNHIPPGPDRPQRGLPHSRIARQGASGRVSYPTAPQIRVPGAPGSAAFQPSQQSPPHQQQSFISNESYFYDQQQQQQPQQPQQPQPPPPHSSYNFVTYQTDQYSSSPNYTPSSELVTLPSSVSTPSVGGTDDGQTRAYPLPSHSQHAHNPNAQGSTSRHASGSAPRGRGRPSKTTKRPRVEDAQDGDSDTQSDDDRGLDGGFTTVSVPPPQGQGSLPSRL